MPLLRRDTAVTIQWVCGHDSIEGDAIKAAITHALLRCFLTSILFIILLTAVTERYRKSLSYNPIYKSKLTEGSPAPQLSVPVSVLIDEFDTSAH
jgi:hypothetical protein